jgi:hypothetical protein
MPLTASGNKVMSNMTKEYGPEKGKSVFYASINKGKPGSSKWHKGKKAGKSASGRRAAGRKR